MFTSNSVVLSKFLQVCVRPVVNLGVYNAMGDTAKRSVEYNWLSDNCGLKVSNICLGTMTFGTSSKVLFYMRPVVVCGESARALNVVNAALNECK